MGYYNMIYQYNENKFLNKCKKSKVDGLIVVDLPFPENKKFALKCKKRNQFYSTYFTYNIKKTFKANRKKFTRHDLLY